MLDRIGDWLDRIECKLLSKGTADYTPSASESVACSLLVAVVSIVLTMLLYDRKTGTSEGEMAVFWGINASLSLVLFVAAARAKKKIWSNIPGKTGWFLLHGILFLFGGVLAIAVGLMILALAGMFFWAIIMFFLFRKASRDNAREEAQSKTNELGPNEVIVDDGTIGGRKLTHYLVGGWTDEHGNEYERVGAGDRFVKK